MFRRAWRALLLASAGMVVLTLAVPVVSAQAYSVGNYYKLVNYVDQQCLYTSGYKEWLFPEGCAQGNSSQKWLLESGSGGSYKFKNQQYGGCMEDLAGNPFDDLCTGGEDIQRFILQSTSRPGYYKIVVQSDGSCLTDLDPAEPQFDLCAQGNGQQYFALQAAS